MNVLVLVALFAAGLPVVVQQCSAVLAEDMVRVAEKSYPSDSILRRASQPRTLILTASEASWRQSHSRFLEDLQHDGHQVSFLTGFAELHPNELDQWDNVILADSYRSVAGDASAKAQEFLKSIAFVGDAGGSLAAFGLAPKSLGIDLARHMGIRLAADSDVQDPMNHIEDDVTMVKAKAILPGGVFSSELEREPLIYKGPGQILPEDNVLPFALLSGTPSTFVRKSKQLHSGSQLTLVSALQTRNNSRIVFFGDSQFCSDDRLLVSSYNQDFCRETLQWTARRRGVVDWSNLLHRKLGAERPQAMYRIKDDLEFKIDLFTLSDTKKNNGSLSTTTLNWVPFDQPEAVQMEFTMLDPHYRLHLKRTASMALSPTAHVEFKCPDKYGIFKFVVRLSKKGYSFLHLESISPVRNFKHNDYERFLWCAYPYYASCLGTLALTLAFAFSFLRLDTSTTKTAQD